MSGTSNILFGIFLILVSSIYIAGGIVYILKGKERKIVHIWESKMDEIEKQKKSIISKQKDEIEGKERNAWESIENYKESHPDYLSISEQFKEYDLLFKNWAPLSHEKAVIDLKELSIDKEMRELRAKTKPPTKYQDL